MTKFIPHEVQKKRRPRRLARLALRGLALGSSMAVAICSILALGAYGGYWYYNEVSYAAPTITVVSPETDTKTTLPFGEHTLLSQPDFFTQVHTAFVENKTTFLEANLSTMKLRFYREGTLEKEVDILTKGKEGSWWETPAGLYAVQTKEENHFSSFGHVYQPWSMAFQGNFFIHGWPYHPDGTPVATEFSGGCIRLSDEDAEAIFNLVEVDTPVLVYEDDYASDGFAYTVATPNVSADHYAVLDIESGTILTAHEMHTVRPIASVTKLVTALAAVEHINLDKDIYITSSMLASTSVSRLQAGQSVSAYSLLLPLLLESSNEAAEAFAQKVGRGRFVELMNEKAKALGMNDTHFADPAGSEHANVSTVADLLRLAQYLYNNRSFILGISSGKEVPTLYRTTAFGTLENFNIVEGVGGFLGGKVGENSIGQTSLSFYEVMVDGAPRRIAVVLLDSDDREKDIRTILAHIERTYGAIVAKEQ